MNKLKDYSSDFQKLIAPFPNGTVIETQPKRAHIPVQVYQKRLEDIVGEHWHWRIVDMPKILFNEQMIIVKGELQVHQAVRQAIGFSNFNNATEPRQIKNSIASAEADAFRNCCDYFQMGWVDLAPYREWAKNPAININPPLTTRTVGDLQPNKKEASLVDCCLRCNIPLTSEDKLFLNIHQIQLLYCIEHVPKHFIKGQEGE